MQYLWSSNIKNWWLYSYALYLWKLFLLFMWRSTRRKSWMQTSKTSQLYAKCKMGVIALVTLVWKDELFLPKIDTLYFTPKKFIVQTNYSLGFGIFLYIVSSSNSTHSCFNVLRYCMYFAKYFDLLFTSSLLRHMFRQSWVVS